MIFLHLFLGIIAPLIIPIYDLLFYSLKIQSKKPNSVYGSKKESAVAHESNRNIKKNAFFSELPSAFIGSSIWGLTYKVDNISAELGWLTIWLICIFVAIGFYIAEKKTESKWFVKLSLLFELLLIVLVFIRIFGIFFC